MSKRARKTAALMGGVPNGDPIQPGHVTTPAEDSERVRALAYAEGYNLAGIALPGPYPEHRKMKSFVERGYAGTMRYLAERAEERMDPLKVAPWARSAVVVGLFYQTPYPHTKDALATASDDDRLWISRYAWGRDYHRVLTKMNRRLVKKLHAAFGEERQFRQYVDTGPVMEKVLARYAGLGWIGKNTMLISPAAGSWFFLGVIFTDLELTPAETIDDHCGSCTRCLDVCPTKAFPEPYVLDATRCISYRTIETRDEELPSDLASGMGAHLFGCDLCQDVCPFNHRSPMTILQDFQPRAHGYLPERTAIDALLEAPEALQERVRGTPLGRAGHKGLSRTLRWKDAQTAEKAKGPTDLDSG